MTRNKISPKLARFIALTFIWGSLGAVIVAGILLVYVYMDAVTPYVVYYVIVLGATIFIDLLVSRLVLRGKSLRMVARVPMIAWTCIVLAGGFTGMYFTVPKIAAEYFATGPYMTWSTGQDPSNATTVMWVTSYNENSEVHYGTSRSSLDTVATGTGNTRFHHVAIGGLSPNTTYYYQVGGYPVKQFTTAPVGSFNYSFCVWSDHRTNTDITISYTQPNIIENMSKMVAAAGINPAFNFFCGDLTSQSNDYLSWKAWFDDTAYHDWSANRSLGIAFGNHERYGDPDMVNVKNFYPYTQQSDGHFYYSFNYGEAHFIVIDTYAGDHTFASNFTDSQLAWLKNDLETHKSANFTVIFTHPPPYAYAGVKGELTKLSEFYNIDLVFCGHDHIFDLRNISSIKVMTIGLGGNPNNEYSAFPCNTAFARVDISPAKMHVIAQFINNTVLSNFTIPA